MKIYTINTMNNWVEIFLIVKGCRRANRYTRPQAQPLPTVTWAFTWSFFLSRVFCAHALYLKVSEAVWGRVCERTFAIYTPNILNLEM